MRKIDCNDCQHLNMTEEEQKIIRNGNCLPHICQKYKRCVYHISNCRSHHARLVPCIGCITDDYRQFRVRNKMIENEWRSKMKAYLIIEENSPELAVECGNCEIIGLFSTREAAVDKVSDIIYDSNSNDYYVVDDIAHNDGNHEWTLYYHGDEDEILWYSVKMIPMIIQ